MRALQLPLKQTNYELFAPARIVLFCIYCLRVKTDSQTDFVRFGEEAVNDSLDIVIHPLLFAGSCGFARKYSPQLNEE